jgi:transcriptional regulator with XRE-family HTH domain
VRPATYDQLLRTLAANVRNYRIQLKISQEEAAERAEMAVRQWQRVESGCAITLRTLVAVASALGVQVADLLKR